MSSRRQLKVSRLLPVILIWLSLALAGCSENEEAIPTLSVEDSPTATETPSPSPTSTPAPTSTPDDGLTEQQRVLLHDLALYEDIRDLPADSSLRESALGLIEALWPAEGDQMIAVEKVIFEQTEFDPDLPSSGINRDQYYVQVVKEVGSRDEEHASQFPLGSVILWNNQEEHESIQDTLLVYKPMPGEELHFTVIKHADGNEYRALISIYDETGIPSAYTDPTGDYWLESIYDPDLVFLAKEEGSSFYWRRAISNEDEDGLVFWNRTGEPFPVYPEGTEGLKLYSEQNEEGESTAYLVLVDEEGRIEKKYQLTENEEDERIWEITVPPKMPDPEFILEGGKRFVIYNNEKIELNTLSRGGISGTIPAGIRNERIVEGNLRNQYFSGYIVEDIKKRDDDYWELTAVIPRETDGKLITFRLVSPGAGIPGSIIYGHLFSGSRKEGVWLFENNDILYYTITSPDGYAGTGLHEYLIKGEQLLFSVGIGYIKPDWASDTTFCAPLCQRRFRQLTDPLTEEQLDFGLDVIRGEEEMPEEPLELSVQALIVGAPRLED